MLFPCFLPLQQQSFLTRVKLLQCLASAFCRMSFPKKLFRAQETVLLEESSHCFVNSAQIHLIFSFPTMQVYSFHNSPFSAKTDRWFG